MRTERWWKAHAAWPALKKGGPGCFFRRQAVVKLIREPFGLLFNMLLGLAHGRASGYANDGHGFSIGFDSELFPCSTGIPQPAFTNETKLRLCRVEYQLDAQQNFIRQSLELVMRDLTAKEGEIPLGQQLQWASISMKAKGIALPELPRGGIHDLISQLTGYSVIAKNPAFHEEREHRLIHAPMVVADRTTNKTTGSHFEISDPKYRVTNNRICSYYEFDFSEYISKGIIAEIVKGPKNGTSDSDLAAIFGRMEHTNIPVRQSKASYR